ncbi:MAG: glutathione S-transferase family protein [Polyangiales bacterium]
MTLKLHGHPISGHVHRVRLFLSLLGLPFEDVLVDLRKGEHKSPAFLAKNPFGQVPVLEDGDVTIADSNAILVYLALKHDADGTWLPRDPAGAAAVQRWLSAAAGPLANGPSPLRAEVLLGVSIDRERAQRLTDQLLGVLEQTLGARPYLVGARATLADVALYSYTSLAPEGGVSLASYPSVRAWLARIEALPGFVHPQRVQAGG